MNPARAGAYMCAALLLALTQGLGMNLVTANIPQIQGSIGATSNEATWMVAAYMAPNVSLSLALIKIRTQFGLRNFAEISILGFVVACVLNLFIRDIPSAIAVRFMSGIAAAPMSSLGFLYMLEAFPPHLKMRVGLPLALTNISIGAPVARLISPTLFDIGGWHNITVVELGMAMIAFCLVYLLPLTPPPRAKVIERLDIVSYLLIAIGFGATAVVLVLGRLYWWFEAPWIGALLALAIVSITCAAIIELNRANPLIDVRWLASPAVLHFTGALLVFRIVLSEQTAGAAGFFQVLGLLNDQTITLYWVILTATIAGGLACACVMKPGREPAIHVVALILLAIGALMDSRATNLTRPEQMYFSQALIAFAGALFLPPALSSGLSSALKKGPNYILSFIIVFLTTQSIGGLLGSAVFGTFITIREKFHSSHLVEHLVLTDPLVAQRITQLGGGYARTITDKALLNAEGMVLLSQQATREANVLAYNDAFLLIAVLAIIALAALLIHVAYDAARGRFAPIPATPTA
ncbi:MFS transporter [Mesorhizobium sp. LHD-90]|uniref:MFS transporter n=1 Tax=Mesorhizobium sp. LHD-90 TaxID=3071414 RepID=UPI0027E13081|nr:MFS transporter [Mesorhizobium sp. LHD-90]MDQ6436655.1 MFS transporter [Mesorhizobium sp. LHD-90]